MSEVKIYKVGDFVRITVDHPSGVEHENVKNCVGTITKVCEPHTEGGEYEYEVTCGHYSSFWYIASELVPATQVEIEAVLYGLLAKMAG